MIGTSSAMNADGSAFSQEERVHAEFLRQDYFPPDAEVKNLRTDFFVVLLDGSEHPVGGSPSIDLPAGEEYTLILTGNAETGFILK